MTDHPAPSDLHDAVGRVSEADLLLLVEDPASASPRLLRRVQNDRALAAAVEAMQRDRAALSAGLSTGLSTGPHTSDASLATLLADALEEAEREAERAVLIGLAGGAASATGDAVPPPRLGIRPRSPASRAAWRDAALAARRAVTLPSLRVTLPLAAAALLVLGGGALFLAQELMRAEAGPGPQAGLQTGPLANALDTPSDTTRRDALTEGRPLDDPAIATATPPTDGRPDASTAIADARTGASAGGTPNPAELPDERRTELPAATATALAAHTPLGPSRAAAHAQAAADASATPRVASLADAASLLAEGRLAIALRLPAVAPNDGVPINPADAAAVVARIGTSSTNAWRVQPNADPTLALALSRDAGVLALSPAARPGPTEATPPALAHAEDAIAAPGAGPSPSPSPSPGPSPNPSRDPRSPQAAAFGTPLDAAPAGLLTAQVAPRRPALAALLRALQQTGGRTELVALESPMTPAELASWARGHTICDHPPRPAADARRGAFLELPIMLQPATP